VKVKCKVLFKGQQILRGKWRIVRTHLSISNGETYSFQKVTFHWFWDAKFFMFWTEMCLNIVSNQVVNMCTVYMFKFGHSCSCGSYACRVKYKGWGQLLFFLVVLGIEPRALHRLSKFTISLNYKPSLSSIAFQSVFKKSMPSQHWSFIMQKGTEPENDT
jgi:hypothetical protein